MNITISSLGIEAIVYAIFNLSVESTFVFAAILITVKEILVRYKVLSVIYLFAFN